jgi:phosphoenolpyruvate---glycerone phosphotransferase subunit DhaM
VIGIVVVSHSPDLARAAVELARQMGGAHPPVIEIAAGTPEGELGTDAVAIAAAIDRAASPDGVLVVMDLGSALLSAEMALDLREAETRVVLSAAPFVEGIVAAVVLAAGGADLDRAAAEAGRALEAKSAHLAADDPAPARAPGAGSAQESDEELSFDTIVRNPSGLHARPAAAFARAAGRHDARVLVTDLDTGAAPVAGGSLIALMSLGVRPGTRIRVSASGPDAAAAIAELRELADTGFGEL